MNPEAEALLIFWLYITGCAVIILSTLLVFGYIWLKQDLKDRKDSRDFTKIMIRLYEKELEEKEKVDKGGFGT